MIRQSTARKSDIPLKKCAVLRQPRPRLVRQRGLGSHDVPKTLRVIRLDQMGEFMDYDIVYDEHRGLN